MKPPYMAETKIVIHKSRGEVSLVEQDTIENISATYLKFIGRYNIFKKKLPMKT